MRKFRNKQNLSFTFISKYSFHVKNATSILDLSRLFLKIISVIPKGLIMDLSAGGKVKKNPNCCEYASSAGFCHSLLILRCCAGELRWCTQSSPAPDTAKLCGILGLGGSRETSQLTFRAPPPHSTTVTRQLQLSTGHLLCLPCSCTLPCNFLWST